MEATAAEASAAAAVASAAPPSQLAYYAVHESAITSALDAYTMEKQPADPVLHLGKQLVASAEKAAGIRRLTLEEAEALLAAESTGSQLRPLGFAGYEAHEKGLEGLLGPPPRRDFFGAMEREHCASSDSRQTFTTSNYGIQTTPLMEWWAATDPVGGLEKLGIDSYPKESAENVGAR